MIEVHSQQLSSGNNDDIGLSVYSWSVDLQIPGDRLLKHRLKLSRENRVDSPPTIRHEGEAVEHACHLVGLKRVLEHEGLPSFTWVWNTLDHEWSGPCNCVKRR